MHLLGINRSEADSFVMSWLSAAQCRSKEGERDLAHDDRVNRQPQLSFLAPPPLSHAQTLFL